MLAATAVLLLTGCSKTVQWEEEVPLNTGETIWAKRTVKYRIGGDAGNPFDMAYRPERDEQIEFTWSGKFYRYKGDARVLLLAISPKRQPVLVAKAADLSWDAIHGYQCTIPYYVQLIPDETGNVWTWPPKIDVWLYNMTPNLLLPRHPLSRMKQRYKAADVQRENYPGTENNPSQQKIDPAYTGDRCKREEK